MVIDYTITIGNLVEIASIIGGGLMVMITLRSDVANIKAEVGGIQLEIRKINDVLITQADQNRRILHLEEDFRELRHGHGFIQSRSTPGIDRDYPTIAIIGAVLFMSTDHPPPRVSLRLASSSSSLARPW
jgi:hypothetical protein